MIKDHLWIVSGFCSMIVFCAPALAAGVGSAKEAVNTGAYDEATEEYTDSLLKAIMLTP